MISFGPQVRVFVATQPIDFRTGVHGLVALVAQDCKPTLTYVGTFSFFAPSGPTV